MARVAASVGLSEEKAAAPQFAPAVDVVCGGVLLALPALLAVGLLRHAERHFALPVTVDEVWTHPSAIIGPT